jgi:hypothetical protein
VRQRQQPPLQNRRSSPPRHPPNRRALTLRSRPSRESSPRATNEKQGVTPSQKDPRMPRGPTPHRKSRNCPPEDTNQREKPPRRLVGEATPGIPEPSPRTIQTRERNHQDALWAKPTSGVWGSSPRRYMLGAGARRATNMVRGCPSPGGIARGTARSRPWGGRPDPSLKKHIPNAAQHEAAQVNYNINELIVNRCSAGLFAASGHLSGPCRSRMFGLLVRGCGRPLRGPTGDAPLQEVSALLVGNCM